jgi:hypothetical protein
MGGYRLVHIDGIAVARASARELLHESQRALAFRPVCRVFGRFSYREVRRRAVDRKADAAVSSADGAVEIEKSEMQPGRRSDADCGRSHG